MTIAYGMRKHGCSLKEIHDYVSSRRGGLKLNLGFQMALMDFEKSLLGTQSDIFMSKDRSNRRVRRREGNSGSPAVALPEGDGDGDQATSSFSPVVEVEVSLG